MSVTIINVDAELKTVESTEMIKQICTLLSKYIDKKLYISYDVFGILLRECNEKRTKDHCKFSLKFEEKMEKYDVVATSVHNRLLEHSFYRLESIREGVTDTAIFDRYRTLVLDSNDYFFLCQEGEDIGDYAKGYLRHNISDFIDA